MIFIVDAYNVLKQIVKSSYVDETTRKKFINLVVKFASKTNNYIELVFDGGDYFTETIPNGNVNIVFSGFRFTADDYILRYIEEHYPIGNFVVVTSDYAIKQFAKKYKIKTVNSIEFYKFMSQAFNTKISVIKSPDQAKKISNANLEIDALMEEASKKILIKDFAEEKHIKLEDIVCNFNKKKKKNG